MASLVETLDNEYGKKTPKRITEYNKAIDLYCRLTASRLHESIEVIEDAADNLAYLYFEWHRKLVKPFIKDLCDRYKVASLTEFAVCYIQPLTLSGATYAEIRAINADFAFFCAFNIIADFNDDDESLHFGSPHFKPFNGVVFDLEQKMEKILGNHKQYLSTYNEINQSPPIISNAHCLELIDILYCARWQAQAV